MVGNANFEQQFKRRYDAKDPAIFVSEYLKFDVDDELDAVNKA